MPQSQLKGCTIVFDLDGTLVDTAPDLHAALNHCLALHDHPEVPYEAIRHMIGEGAKAMIRKGLEHAGAEPHETLVEELWPEFIDYYRANICRLSRFFPDAEATLDELAGLGARMAVCTNKLQGLAEEVLDGLGARSRFAALVGADSVENKKPHGGHILHTIEAAGGTASRAVMVGDSQTDERAARHAGLPFVFVPFGYGPAPEKSASDFTVARSYREMIAAIEGALA